MAVVYQHRRLDTNEVFYIGIGKTNSRAYSSKQRNKYWKGIVNKHGFDVDILIDGCNIEDAKRIETGMIDSYGRKDLGTGILCNMTAGGDGTLNHSPEVLESISFKLKGRNLSNSTKNKMSESRKGRKLSEFTRKKISERLKGKTISIDTKSKMSAMASKKRPYRKKVILQCFLDGTVFAEHVGVKEAISTTNIKGIANVLTGRVKTAGGYLWTYKL